MTQIQQQKAAREFAERWKGKGYEKGESQIFWSTLLTEVFGVEHVDLLPAKLPNPSASPVSSRCTSS